MTFGKILKGCLLMGCLIYLIMVASFVDNGWKSLGRYVRGAYAHLTGRRMEC